MSEVASNFLSASSEHLQLFDDGSGTYRICRPTRVTVGDWMYEYPVHKNKYGQDVEELLVLECGHIVEVVDVQFHIETNRVRGQISNPKGWISIRDVWTHDRWAMKIGDEHVQSCPWKLTQNSFHFQASYDIPDDISEEEGYLSMVKKDISAALGSDWIVHAERQDNDSYKPASSKQLCIMSVNIGSIVRDFKKRCVLAFQRCASRYAAVYPFRGSFHGRQAIPGLVRKRLQLDFSGAAVDPHSYGFDHHDGSSIERTDVVVLKVCIPGSTSCDTCSMLRNVFNSAIESKVRELARNFLDVFASKAPSSTFVCQEINSLCADEMTVQTMACMLKAKLSLDLCMDVEVWHEDYKYPLGSERYMDTDEPEAEVDDGVYVSCLPGPVTFEGLTLWVSVVFVERILRRFDEKVNDKCCNGIEVVQIVDVPFGCKSTGGVSSSAWGVSEAIPGDREGELYKITNAPFGKFDGHPLGFLQARSLCLRIGNLMDIMGSFHFDAGHYGGKAFRYEVRQWDPDLGWVTFKDGADYFVEVLGQDIEKMHYSDEREKMHYLERLTRYCVEIKRGETPPPSPRKFIEDSWSDDYE